MKYLIPIILIVLIYYLLSTSSDTRRACNEVDGRCYEVISKYDSTTDKNASELLAYLNNYSIALMRHLREKYLWNQQGSIEEQKTIAFLLSNYNPDNIIENDPKTTENTSYVEDKGKIFAICLREKQSGKNSFHYKNILEFVLMHEISHLATRDIGHGKQFWRNFKFIITEAVDAGLHKPVDYSKVSVNYCGLGITENPYFMNFE